MPSTKQLRNCPVVLKMTGANRAFATSVIAEESDGLWFSGGGLMGELAQVDLPVGMKSPTVFLPFSQIQWLMTENQ
jgi:hypothetical protein